MVKLLKKSSSDKKMNLSLHRSKKRSRKSSSSKKQPRSSSQDDELESLVMGANLTSKQEARLMVHYAGRKALLIDHLKHFRSAQKELEKERTRTQEADTDIYGLHNGTNDDEPTPVSEQPNPTLFDHITNVTDAMIDIVESLSTEAEETKEPEDAKVEEDGSHTAVKSDTPIVVENKPTPKPTPVLDEEEEDIIPDIEAAHTNEEPCIEAVLLNNDSIALGIHQHSTPSLEEGVVADVSSCQTIRVLCTIFTSLIDSKSLTW